MSDETQGCTRVAGGVDCGGDNSLTREDLPPDYVEIFDQAMRLHGVGRSERGWQADARLILEVLQSIVRALDVELRISSYLEHLANKSAGSDRDKELIALEHLLGVLKGAFRDQRNGGHIANALMRAHQDLRERSMGYTGESYFDRPLAGRRGDSATYDADLARLTFVEIIYFAQGKWNISSLPEALRRVEEICGVGVGQSTFRSWAGAKPSLRAQGAFEATGMAGYLGSLVADGDELRPDQAATVHRLEFYLSSPDDMRRLVRTARKDTR